MNWQYDFYMKAAEVVAQVAQLFLGLVIFIGVAPRRINTLVLVHRKEILKQWVERFQQFLSVDTGDVGTISWGSS